MTSPSGPISNDVPETAVKIYADKWVATIIASPYPSPDGFFHVNCTTDGVTWLDAINAAIFVMQTYTWGRTSYIRVEPDASSETDFETKKVRHRGVTRFSYKLEAGNRHYPSEIDASLSFLAGEQH